MNSKRPVSFVVVLLLAFLCGAGCSKKARLARLGRSADADFASERYEAAEVEYRDYLRSGLDARVLGQLGLVFSHEGRMLPAFQCLRKSDELNPKSPEIKTALGAAYLSLGAFDEGFRNARAALSMQPTNCEAMLLLSEAARSAQDVESSRTFLRALPGQPDRFPEFHVALATLSLKSRDAVGAEAELRTALARDPKSAEAHYRLSQIYYKAGNIPGATSELKKASDFAAWRSPIRLNAVEIELQMSGEDAGRKSLNDIISHAQDFIPARLALMRLDYDHKHFDNCKKDIAEILDKDPDNYDASLQLGMVDLSQSDFDGALKAFSTLEARRPYAPAVKYYLGVASFDKNQQDQARHYLSQAIALNTNYVEPALLLAEIDIRAKNPSDAIQRLERLIRQQPRLVEPRLLLAEAFSTHQEPERAMAIYRQLVELEPKNPQMPYLMGSAQLQQGDLDGARKSFAKSLELAPDYAAALDRLVGVDIALKQYGAASQRLQEQSKKHPDSGRLWMLQARVFQAQNQIQQAEDALNKAISLDPNLSQAYVSLAELYVAGHQEQQALDKLNAVLARTNDISALMALGVIQEQLKNYQASADAFEKIIAVKPDFLPALNDVACLYSDELGQMDKAYTYAQKANEFGPYNPHCADTLGWVLFRRGEFAAALPLLKKGADGDPGDSEIQCHLGMAYYMTGDEAPARVALQNAVNSLTSFPGKNDARLCLAVLSIDPKSNDPNSVQILEQAVQRDGRDPIAVARLADVDERSGAYDKAAQLFELNLKNNPKNPGTMGRLAALYAYHLQRPEDAFKLARDAHDLDGNDALACAILGRLSYDHGQVDYALSLLQKAASQDQPPPRVFSDLARAEYAEGKVADATTAAQTAIARQGPDDRHDQLFLTLLSAADSPSAAKAALPQAKAALQDNPHDLPALMVCGAAAHADGDDKTAEGYYETALAAFPQFPPALRQSAFLWAGRLSDDDKAFGFAQKGRPYFPTDPQLAKILGRGAYRRGDYALSTQVLQEISSRADDGEILYYLGMDYYKLQRRSESKNALERALAMNIPSGLASDAKRILAELK